MLYYKDLRKVVFENYPTSADELKILSGYVGPVPMRDLKTLPLKSTVIFGLFNENRKRKLHDEILKIHDAQTSIYYPQTLSHSKCYVWLKEGKAIRALIGSANFSSNGLNSDYRETLFEVDEKQATIVNGYIDLILNTGKPCTEFTDAAIFEESPRQKATRQLQQGYTEGVAVLSLLANNEVPQASGLNWGMAEGSHVRENDAYIAIRKDSIRLHPELFMPRHELPQGEARRGNIDEIVELIWDDGEIMQVRFEGTQHISELGDRKYPKQIASFPNKDILGTYLRKRLGVPLGTPVKKHHLMSYGSTDIKLSRLEDGIYSADFSPNSK